MDKEADIRRTVKNYQKNSDDRDVGSEYSEKCVHLLALHIHLFINLTHHLINELVSIY